jgi:DNA-binding CsgD family transcriptional regulator
MPHCIGSRGYNPAMQIDSRTAARVHVVWDQLADFDAARTEDMLRYLLASLCDLVDAQNASWMGVVRLDAMSGDPVRGWRPRSVSYLHPSPPLDDAVREQIRKLEQGSVDETTIRSVIHAGTFRANRLVDLVPETWFRSDYYRCHYLALGRADAIWAGCPVNPDSECYYGVMRDAAHPRFSVEERDVVAYALRGLKWFHRQQLLARGLLVASSPLTPAERGILQGLLGGLTEKQIAAAQDQSYHTAHEHVTNIFRKFDVNNRAALMALWLGKTAEAPPPN